MPKGRAPAIPGSLLTTSAEVAEFCASIAGADYVTVDTEFMRESTYWPQVCLVQIAGPERAAAIDTLAPGMDLAPVLAIFNDPAVLKVFHAGRQDIEIFHHLCGKVPAPIFDTQIAAMVCGFGDSVGYETLVAKFAGAAIDKSSRFTDWSARPLRPQQITYALADVIYLRAVYDKLAKLLDNSGRAEWLHEELATLTALETYEADPRKAYLRIRTRAMSPRVLAILREIAAWREEEAQRRDLPRNRLLRDEALLEIAHHAPADVEELARTRGLGRRLAEGDSGQRILAAVARGQAVPDADCPRPPLKRDLPKERGPIADLLKVLLKLKCGEFDVAQKLVASAEDVEILAALGERAEVPALGGWRRQVFGNEALRLLGGQLALVARKGQLVALPFPDAAAAEK